MGQRPSPARLSTSPAGCSPARSWQRRAASAETAVWKGMVTVHHKDNNDNTETLDVVVVTRVLDAPVEEVWKAWSDPEYVMRWWGPTGFRSPSAEMDFRVGGASLVCMGAPAEARTVARTCTTRGPTPGSTRTRGSNSSPISRTKTGHISTPPRWACPLESRTTWRR